ncbi:leucyl aminopeptidase family protein [Roseinatronobacter alkalisoli]|uniref:Leucyl aminopeptidase family protein n=1 Tax=Roseinatronobacter alkalisoli TaxID=3028235 RepID=A0ABT5T8Z6_9RHOB|nr:leucyl aminopeptidase family protein [Roseinatronobacter sp. HJB301]MDD7971588.1 leucyl aminopeptidase family protein [Roseinatronobacter sp. HJB301]
MTELTAPPSMRFVAQSGRTVPLHLVTADGLAAWTEMQPRRMRAWLEATGFAARVGTVALVPDPDGGLAAAAVGLGSDIDRQRTRFNLGGARARLPAATFHLEHALPQAALDEELLGWLLAGYRFDRFRRPDARPLADLIAPDGVDVARLEAIAAGEALTRDLINTPASHMGPEELEGAVVGLANRFGAAVSVIYGDDLLYHNFPLVHAVGRASDRSPRLVDMRWGKAGPLLTLVGKGVCFDTGGLNLKPGASMGLMKKDMGGAATVIGLAHMIMAQGWPVRLRVIIPAVENSVSGNAMRPGDILLSRKGLSIEINNTDAEGRLVLADALALADEEPPDLMVCMATLTGAARVAVGPDIAPFFTRDRALSDALMKAGDAVRDPVWPLPLHSGYETNIQPAIADLDNAPAGGMAGAITAALFLHRFVENTPRFVHFDIYGHQPSAAPARPKGGVGQAARALFDALPAALAL